MRGVPCRRGPLLTTLAAALSAALSAAVLVAAPAFAAPAGTVAAGAVSATDPDLSLGSAAALGVGAAVSAVLADDAQVAAAAVGAAATRVRPPAGAASSAAAARTWRWNGWVSGAAGPETLDGSFGAWRGEPLGLIGAWADSDVATQTTMSTVAAYSGYAGQMDVAVGGLVEGETWALAARGAYVTRWRAGIRALRSLRGGKGTTYIRFAHELNGDWMPWGVTSAAEAADYKKAYRLYAQLVRTEFPQARLSWSPNVTHHSAVSIDDLYPGDDVVDVVAPDLYDFDDDPTTAASWALESTSWLTKSSPNGIDAWRVWASRHGKAVAIAEWGLAAGDDPEWITRVHAYLSEHAAAKGGGRVAGRFVYDCYFNAESSFKLSARSNPRAAAAYAALRWGN